MRRPALLVAVGLLLFAIGCGRPRPVTVPTEPTRPRADGWTERGDASWYGDPYHGRTTASGEIYDMHEMTAAHRSLPFNTMVRVARRDSGAEVEVRINDRGPFIKGRIIDLSFAAAKVIGLEIDGVAPVKVKVLGQAAPVRKNPSRETRPAENNARACFWVQVGAFGDAVNAARAKESLVRDGEKALVIEGPDGLERVRVGPFDDEGEAHETCDRLLSRWPVSRVVECGG